MILRDESKRILVVGQVFIDRHLDHQRIRLGGVFHIARALDALKANYAAAYMCPAYLEGDCATYFSRLNAHDYRKIGDVTGSPNVIEIGQSGEAGNQSYSDLLRDSRRTALDLAALIEFIGVYGPTDTMIVGDTYDDDLLKTLVQFGGRLHVDTDHDALNLWGRVRDLSTVFCSTSGASFETCQRVPARLRASWTSVNARMIVLKENRGGSRVWVPQLSEIESEAPAYPTFTQHSVGVGDCFGAVWVAASEGETPEARLRASSYVSSLYASTFDHDIFVNDVRTAVTIRPEISRLKGVRIPWERRPSISIYLAAPDFPYVNTDKLSELDAAIRYHNFNPRRPIQENGLADIDMSPANRRALYAKDMALLDGCQLLVAIPLIDDPGTFAELGWFSNSGKPTILYDPERRVTNVFVVNAATRICLTSTSVIDAVFELLGRVDDDL